MEELSRSKRMYFGKPHRRHFPLRLLILIILLLTVIYLIFGALGWGRSERLKGYVNETNKVVRKSNKVAKDFEALRTTATSVDRTQLRKKLGTFVNGSEKILKETEKLEVPSEAEKAHEYLLLTFRLRVRGLKNYKTSLFNALKDVDIEVASFQVQDAFKALALSDKMYALYVEEIKQALSKVRAETKVTGSKFVADEAVYEKANIISYLSRLKGLRSLEEVHEIEIADLITRPKRTQFISERNLSILPKASALSVMVVIENKGNQIEYNLPVTAALKSTASTSEQKEEIRVISVEPGERKTVTLSGFKPALGASVINLLTISAGPVPKESQTQNNTKEFKFTMR